MKTQHTPLPWVFAYGSIYRSDTLHDESSIRIALMDRNEPHTMPTERDANAEFIVKACNAHDELLAACKAALECQLSPLDENTVDTLEAAIAKAEGNCHEC